MITNTNAPVSEQKKFPKVFPKVSGTLPTGELYELLYQPKSNQTQFVYSKDGELAYAKELPIGKTEKIVPYSPFNNLIQNKVILFPSEPLEYGTEQELLDEIRAYIHRYVDVSPLYEQIATYYVLISWIYDGFNELPYLRLRGEPGSGKTRFLQTVGSICYKPIFASGASSTSPLFRILDAVRGTLIIDESDFRMSDEKAEMVKILNNGNAKGFPVLRSEVSADNKEFNPRAYHVFGPKILATRGYFEDRALETRLLSEEMGQHKLRQDIPINLPDTYKDEALQLRNKLLLFRFRNLNQRPIVDGLVDRTIEPRLNQIFIPLLSIIQDEEAREGIRSLARSYHQQMVSERGMDVEAQILEVVRDLNCSADANPSIQDITGIFAKRYGQEYDRKITSKWIGYIIRARLGLKTHKSQGVYVLPLTEQAKLDRLYERYGIAPLENQEEVAPSTSHAPSPPENLPLEK